VTGTEVPLVERSTLKTAGGRPQAAVDLRREIVVNRAFFVLIKKRINRRPSTREEILT
jgi:hypothetical protein